MLPRCQQSENLIDPAYYGLRAQSFERIKRMTAPSRTADEGAAEMLQDRSTTTLGKLRCGDGSNSNGG